MELGIGLTSLLWQKLAAAFAEMLQTDTVQHELRFCQLDVKFILLDAGLRCRQSWMQEAGTLSASTFTQHRLALCI